jgi:hypothetical protein
MTEAKHTPGPWSVGPTHHESEGKSWLFYSHQTHILAPNGLTDLAIVEAGEEEGQANARLIAAAPDLLAACQDIEIALADTKFASSPLYKQMLAAIEKAVGDQ